MPNHIVYQAYGTHGIRAQALFAAYSALAYTPAFCRAAYGAAGPTPTDARIHVYTDDPTFFRPLQDVIVIHHLSPERIREWRGPLDFTHRLKVAMLLDRMAAHPEDKLLYLDADTFFTRDLAGLFERIDARNALMHVREYPVWTHPSGQIKRFRKHLRPLRFRGEPVDLHGWMWNAGAVGVHPSQFGLFHTILAFIDEIYPQYRKGLVEQYGISLFLQQNVTLHPCDDYVFHYWARKDAYETAICTRLERLRALPLEMALANLREEPLQVPPPEARRPWWKIWG